MHRTSTFILIFTTFFSVSSLLMGQTLNGTEAAVRLRGAEEIRLSELSGDIQYARLGDDAGIAQEQAVSWLRKVYRLGEAYGFTVISDEKDELGFTHVRYQLHYNKVKILGAVLIAHFRDGYLRSFNGEVFRVNETAGGGLLTESACLQVALDSVHAESYLWEHPEEESVIKEIKGDPKATWFPKAELVYVPVALAFGSGEFRLCYRFNIHAWQPRTAENLYISAVNGSLVARENMLHTTDVPGVAHTKYSGIKNIITDSTAPYNYRLRENTRGNGVYTFNMKKGTNYGAAVDFTDSNNVWNNVNLNKDEVATDAHWGAEITFDYFKNKFNRNSYNNANARINSYVHYANNYDNAFWDGVRMTYGDGNTFRPLVCLDVCGHEIAHAVTTYSANLIYSYESGQLNESFSDIFGNSIERYGKPGGYSWKIGEEITSTGNGLRDMKDPRLRGHPRCYKGTYWYYGAGDNGGVHLNSGVQNWWYYLITEGGSGTNDFSKTYKVDSLGILSAEKIAYRNLTVYLTPTSQYSDARFYSIQAAKDLFGPCSKEVIAVTNAWYACNVGPVYDSGYVKADFTADTVICGPSKPVRFFNRSTNAVSYKWSFGDGDTSSAFSPVKAYPAYGNYTVKLVANSCFKNKKDSLIRVAYVKVDSNHHICNAVLMPASGTDSTSKCKSYVYDDGGEDIYKQMRKTNLRISVPGADSIRIRFMDFDYELNYDSLYIYRGLFPGGTKVGGYTGSVLPAAGNWISVAGSVVTLRHISDPYVIGRGFKLYYEAVRKPVRVTAWQDTAICLGNTVLLRATGSGGHPKDNVFLWKGFAWNDSVTVAPRVNTDYKVLMRDVCMNSVDSATVTVRVRDSLQLHAISDTLICSGQSVRIDLTAEGGDSSAHTFTWDHGLGSGSGKTIAPVSTTIYRVILSDGCTPVQDTAYIRVRVKDPLRVDLSSVDTLICYNRQSKVYAHASGGDTVNHSFQWSHGAPMGNSTTAILNSSAYVRVTLTDGCSAQPATDSMFIVVRDKLTVDLGKDTTLCYGRGTVLRALAAGGDVKAHEYIWTPALSDTSVHTVFPSASTTYTVTLRDNCSDETYDTLTVSLLEPIVVSGLRDTTICNGIEVPLRPVVSGGTGIYVYTWNLGLPDSSAHTVAPAGTSSYRVIVNDNCTVHGDTATAVVTVKSPLRVDIDTDDTLICHNKTAALLATGNGGDNTAYTYQWSHSLGTGNTKTITLTSDAWVKVSLTDACTVEPGTDSVFIKVRPELRVSLPADTLICYGSQTDISAAATGGDQSAWNYSWNMSLPAQQAHIVSPAVNTLYTVTLSDNCSDDATDTVMISVMPQLTLSGLRDTVICSGGSATLLPLASGGISSQYVYSWDNGLGNGPVQQVSPAGTTLYTVTLNDACSSPGASASVRVSVRAPLQLSASLSDASVCAGDSSLLTLGFSGGVPSGYRWFINGSESFVTSEWKKPAADANYRIELYDYCSVADTQILLLNVNPLPVPAFSTVATEVCRDAGVSFSNLSSGAVQYRWYFGTGDSSAVPSPVYRYTEAGAFYVRLRAWTDSGCTAETSLPYVITVYDLPESRFTWSPDPPDFLNRLVRFDNASLNSSSFEWDFGDLSKETLITDPEHLYADTGHYPVRLITRNVIGCADTLIQMLRIKDVFRCFIPDAITMNYDNLNDSFIILGRGIMTYNLKIYNRWGEMVYKGSMGDKPFDGRDTKGEPLMKGTYIIHLAVRDFEGFMHYYRQVLEIL